MFDVTAYEYGLRFGRHFVLSFVRTVRIPDDGREYPLPAGLEEFPIYKVSDYIDTVPFDWIKNGGGVFFPMYQCEAMWINFDYPDWHPHALRIGAGGVNVVTGDKFMDNMRRGVEDNLVCPSQPWLDGFNIGDGTVRQFVASPLGYGKTAEAKIFGEEKKGGLHIVVVPPKSGLFPEEDPYVFALFQMDDSESAVEMGLAGGGKITQKIYPDNYGYDVWDEGMAARVEVHIVNSLMFRQITGLNPPPTPINYQVYKKLGLPWFKIFDDEMAFIDSKDFFSD